jgi:glutamine kinase
MKTSLKKIYTKAESLNFMQPFQKKFNFKIPPFFYFTKKKYLNNKDLIFNQIQQKFKKKSIIIRSSSLQEDTLKKSNAGKYKSFSNLKVNKETIFKYTNLVINDFKNNNDQIIVQEFISKPKFSGVIFTRNINNNAPYYIINYDKSGFTDLITSGKFNLSLKTLVVNRDVINRSNYILKNLETIKNLEKKFLNDRLDIEFCIKNNIFYVLQCRSLKYLKNVNDILIREAVVNISKKITKIKKKIPNLCGETTYFSNMSDWNPAEMIGVKPSILSSSLYSELITDEVWSEQRSNYGYKDVRPNPLMLNLGGSPYIDLRVDFNSFLPAGLPLKIQEKSINFYLNKIKIKPNLHDKIEFEIVETCYDLNSKKKLLQFLSKNETNIYLNRLRKLTNNIIYNNSMFLGKEIKKIEKLKKSINTIKKSNISEIQKIYFLIKDCKKFGTLPFAGIARCAFIATRILRSLVENKILSINSFEKFYASIHTVNKEMNFSYSKINSKIKKNNFLKKYGHLRPSTYSILSKNYNENFNKYFPKKTKLTVNKAKKFKIDEKEKKKINQIFLNHKLQFNCNKFLQFASDSIRLREYSKLIFTMSIDEIFKNLIKFSKEVELSRKDLEYISIKNFINFYSNVDVERLRKIMKKEINQNKKNFKLLNLIEFPEFIENSKDLYFHEQKSKIANYITNKSTEGEIIILDNIKNYKDINNKIVLLKNADPGFDFIFSHNIKGLITEYGGSNSHMSIRCLELGVPAIIGLGSKEYKILSTKSFITMNCRQKYYKIIN